MFCDQNKKPKKNPKKTEKKLKKNPKKTRSDVQFETLQVNVCDFCSEEAYSKGDFRRPSTNQNCLNMCLELT